MGPDVEKYGDVAEKSGAVAGQLAPLVMRCATCKYWLGDKGRTKRLLEENEISMDIFKGWPNSGSCGIDCEWLETEQWACTLN